MCSSHERTLYLLYIHTNSIPIKFGKKIIWFLRTDIGYSIPRFPTYKRADPRAKVSVHYIHVCIYCFTNVTEYFSSFQ